MSMFIGEALVGDGNEIAHVDLFIGLKDGPVSHAFAKALASQLHGHSHPLAVLTPNLVCKPTTVLITKVTIQGMKQAVQMFGPRAGRRRQAVREQRSGHGRRAGLRAGRGAVSHPLGGRSCRN